MSPSRAKRSRTREHSLSDRRAWSSSRDSATLEPPTPATHSSSRISGQPSLTLLLAIGDTDARDTAVRLVRFGGAMSLAGYIAGPNGEYDWIVMDPDIDFAGLLKQFDTFLIGRKTFEAMRRMGTTPGRRPAFGTRLLADVERGRSSARHRGIGRRARGHRPAQEAGQGHRALWWR